MAANCSPRAQELLRIMKAIGPRAAHRDSTVDEWVVVVLQEPNRTRCDTTSVLVGVCAPRGYF